MGRPHPYRNTDADRKAKPMTQYIQQLDNAALKRMSPEAIVEAKARGECAELLGTPVPVDFAATASESGPRPPRENPAQGGNAPHGADPLVQLDVSDLGALSAEEIVAASQDGRLDNLLGKPPRPVIDHSQPTN